MFKCDSCSYTSKKYFGLCPQCRDGEGVEVDSSAVTVTNSRSIIPKDSQIRSYNIETADDKFDAQEVVKKTGYQNFDKVISTEGGFVRDQVIAFGAQPGIGKSTFCAQISDENTLYITTEESLNQVKGRFHRVNPNSGAKVVSETDFLTILHIIENTDASFIIIDSLNAINNGSDGYAKQASNMVKITATLKEKGKIGVVICQVTRSGDITGMNTLLHAVDTVLYMDKSEFQDMIVVGSSKNRFAEVGSVAIFEHDNNGIKESEDVTSDSIKDFTGVTVTTSKFGYKKITVAIEALVAPSSMNYGLRRANGLNASRVQQIIGVLSSHKIDLSAKDVYLSVSNGLNVNDVNTDLAIANSILSSYYGKPSPFKSLSGIVSLNGTVRKSNEITHIKDLIREFKKES